MKIAHVTWRDATAKHSQEDLSDVIDLPLITLHTSGLLVGEFEDRVLLAQDYWTAKDLKEPQVRDTTIIPRVNIVAMETWDVEIPDLREVEP